MNSINKNHKFDSPNTIDNKISKANNSKRTKSIILVAVVVSLIMIVGNLIAYNRINSNSNDKAIEAVVYTTNKEKELIDKINQTSDPTEKSVLYIELSSEQQLNGKANLATDSAQKANTLDQTAESCAKLGGMMAYNQQYDRAAEYMTKASELSAKTELTENSDYSYYISQANKYKEMADAQKSN